MNSCAIEESEMAIPQGRVDAIIAWAQRTCLSQVVMPSKARLIEFANRIRSFSLLFSLGGLQELSSVQCLESHFSSDRRHFQRCRYLEVSHSRR